MAMRRHANRVSKAATPSESTTYKQPSAGYPLKHLELMCSTIFPNMLVIIVALSAVWFEFTSINFYMRHPELKVFLKRSFIVWTCLAIRKQLKYFTIPPRLANRRPSLKKKLACHARAIFAAIAANLLGTFIIRPVFGASPQVEETVRLVVPIYFLVEVVVGYLHFPVPLLKVIVGLCVSWLKAVMIPKLVMEWHNNTSAHPLGFIAISTANLYASGIVLRYLTKYNRTQRAVPIPWSEFRYFLQIIGFSAIIGLIAHVANHFVLSEQSMMEARVLYFFVTWFMLDKYWKEALGELLLLTLPERKK
ncbi:hypothetical protein CCR75_004482 [Bremia lactucae]|uniref:Uncharacterized protein n=1 Tax=Bremia lactucae TaxID=4779 RepID=A0A976FK05_BRELC|nr:hypothetical protein CCR75_004482 [Bremia lactucae]